MNTTKYYRSGYNDAKKYAHDSAVWVIRNELRHAIKDIKNYSDTNRAKEYKYTRITGIIAGFLVAGLISAHEHDFYYHIIAKITE